MRGGILLDPFVLGQSCPFPVPDGGHRASVQLNKCCANFILLYVQFYITALKWWLFRVQFYVTALMWSALMWSSFCAQKAWLK